MIVERYPELKDLPTDGQLRLAAELIELATDSSPETPNPLIVEALNARREEYLKNPENASAWSEVKARILEKYNGE